MVELLRRRTPWQGLNPSAAELIQPTAVKPTVSEQAALAAQQSHLLRRAKRSIALGLATGVLLGCAIAFKRLEGDMPSADPPSVVQNSASNRAGAP